MRNLTENQKRVLDFIVAYQQDNGFAPTYQTIAQHFQFKSRSSVQQYVESLVEKGFLTKEKYRQQALETHQEGNMIPLLGTVAAGKPIENKKFNEKIEVPLAMLKSGGSYFALKVAGDSMIDEGILDGDYVVIREKQSANNGEIIVAEVNEEATIKKFFKKKSHIELHSANANYKPIIVDSNKDLRIAGVFCGLLRLT